MSRNRILIIAGIVLLIAAGVGGYLFLQPFSQAPDAKTPQAPAAAPSASQGPPLPKMVVLDLGAVTQQSSVGRDLASQMQAFENQTRSEFAGRTRALENEGRQLQAQLESLAPDQRQKRVAAFETKQTALRNEIQKKNDRLKAAYAQAQAAVSKALEPILGQISAQRGANLVLDRRAVPILDDPAMDITADVITQLNAKLPSYKITLPSDSGK